MNINQLTTNLNNHQSLSDNPNANEGYTASQLKVLFDKAPNDIKDYINNTLVPSLNSGVADSGANANITSLTGITNGISSPDFVQFSQDGSTDAVGKLKWNSTDGTLEFGAIGGNVNIQIGQEEVLRVLNNTGSPMTNGQVVYITGASGQRPTVALANASAEGTSSKTIGVLTEDIANNAQGFVTTSGIVRNVNTVSFTEGAALWLSTTSGQITQTKPVAPNHGVLIGFCVRSHATLGMILVKVQNGQELDELHDVLIGTKANNDLLVYETSSGVWKNKSFSTLGLATQDSPSFTGTVTLPSTTSIGNVSSTEIEYLDGVTSSIQTQIDGKVSKSGDTMTGALNLPSNGLIVGTNQLAVSGGNVGIGTSSPTSKLHVIGKVNANGSVSGDVIANLVNSASDGYGIRTQGGGGASGLYVAAFNDYLSNTKMLIDNAGNVGIGTNSPVSLLHTKTSGVNSTYLDTSATTDQIHRIASLYNNGGAYSTLAIDASTHLFRTGTTERMRIDSSGNVLIGDTTTTGGKVKIKSTTEHLRIVNTTVGSNSSEAKTTISFRGYNELERARIEGIDTSFDNNNGKLAFWTSNDGTLGERMRIDSSGNVGIGTTSPTSNLHLNGTTAQTAIRFTNTNGNSIVGVSDTGDLLIQQNLALPIKMLTNGSERMRIDSSGNFMVGTTSSTNHRFNKFNSGGYAMTINNTAGVGSHGLQIYSPNSNDSTGVFLNLQDAGGSRFTVYGNGQGYFAGNLGLATTSPGARLDVNGNIRTTIGSGGWISAYETDATRRNSISMYADANGSVIDASFSTGGSGVLRLLTASSERMRIDASGNVLIGATSTPTSTSGGSAFIQSTLSRRILYLAGTGTTDDTMAVFINGNGQVGSIKTNGSATTFNTSSDYRLKEDNKDFNALSILSNIKMYDYKWKASGERSHGVFAHELQQVIPYAVTGEKDGEQMQGVDYSKLVPILTKAIQELTAKVNELEAKVG